jgi:hypothetical protein
MRIGSCTKTEIRCVVGEEGCPIDKLRVAQKIPGGFSDGIQDSGPPKGRRVKCNKKRDRTVPFFVA